MFDKVEIIFGGDVAHDMRKICSKEFEMLGSVAIGYNEYVNEMMIEHVLVILVFISDD